MIVNYNKILINDTPNPDLLSYLLKLICFSQFIVTQLKVIKGYGADVLRLPHGRFEPIFVTYENDFKPFLAVSRDVYGPW